MTVRVPFPIVSGILNDRAVFELRRNFEALAEVTSASPFVVVASDGTGDYTSIKTAIEAQAQTGNTSGTSAAVIWVKPGTYNDGSTTTVDITSRNIVLIGGFGGHRPSLTGYPEQQWTMGGFRITGAVNGQIIIYGIRMVTTIATFLDGSTTGSSFLFGLFTSEISGATAVFGATCTLNVWGRDSSFGTLFANTAVRVQQLDLDRCTFGFGTGITLSSALAPSYRLRNSTLTSAATFGITTTSSGDGEFMMLNCRFPTAAFALTLTGIGQVVIVGCDQDESTSNNSTLTITGTGTNANRTVALVDSNTLALTNLVLTGNLPTHLNGHVSGIYRTLTIGAHSVSADVTLRATAAVTYLTINNNADWCNVKMTMAQPIAGSQAWAINDGLHIISAAGYSQANITVASAPAPPAAPGSGVGASATCWFTVT